jgi:hypothetical protein
VYGEDRQARANQRCVQSSTPYYSALLASVKIARIIVFLYEQGYIVVYYSRLRPNYPGGVIIAIWIAN